jgi:DNA-binding transcriptional LysR family regulator
MDIRQLRYVVLVGRTRSLRSAAEIEFIAPSVLSSQVRRLESLGVASLPLGASVETEMAVQC